MELTPLRGQRSLSHVGDAAGRCSATLTKCSRNVKRMKRPQSSLCRVWNQQLNKRGCGITLSLVIWFSHTFMLSPTLLFPTLLPLRRSPALYAPMKSIDLLYISSLWAAAAAKTSLMSRPMTENVFAVFALATFRKSLSNQKNSMIQEERSVCL